MSKKLHFYLGITLSLFLLIIAITGLLLNNENLLNLNYKYTSNKIIKKLYNSRNNIKAFKFNTYYVYQHQDDIFINNKFIINHHETVRGGATLKNNIIIALSSYILLLDNNLNLIETINIEFFNIKQINKIATIANKIIVQNQNRNYILDIDKLSKTQINTTNINWSKQTKQLPKNYQDNFNIKIKEISLNKFILDIHTGRILGNNGKYLNDFIAIATIIMIITGLISYIKRKNKHNDKSKT